MEIAKKGIERELTEKTRIAQFKDVEIHIVYGAEAPRTLEEIGRIREREYRVVGAGRGDELDLDAYDTTPPAYAQLVSWDPDEREIVALYRAIHCGWALENRGVEALRTHQLFEFGTEFASTILPRAVELGRSVVNRSAKRAIQGLFSVWVGLGAMVREWPDIEYFFGNVSLYRSLPESAVAGILSYLYDYHAAPSGLVSAHEPSPAWPRDRNRADSAQPREEAFAELERKAATEGWLFPPILLTYLKACPGLLAFDATVDQDFAEAIEVAIAVPIAELTKKTVARFITPYRSTNSHAFAREGRARVS